MIEMPETLTTTQLADEMGISPKTLRKFLRSDADAKGTRDDFCPGKGGRYEIARTQVKGLKSRFIKWDAAEKAARAERAQKAANDAKVAVEDDSPETDEAPEPTE